MSQLIAAVVLTAVEVMCCVLFFRAFLNERTDHKPWKKISIIIALVVSATIVSGFPVGYFWKAVIGCIIY